MGGKRKPQIRKCNGKAAKGANKMAVKGKVAKKKGVAKYPESQIELSPIGTKISRLTMDEISGATIDTWPQDGNSIGASTASAETDMVPLDKVEAMIQNDIAENGDGGDSDTGGDGYSIMEDFMEARRDFEINRLKSDFNEIETNVLDDTANCTM